MQKTIELHRRVKTALQSLSPRTAKKVENAIDLIAKYADNLAKFPGTMVKFLGNELPNTYMIEATPTLRVVFQLTGGEHILIQDILHRDWFTVFGKGGDAPAWGQ
jgi:mRNA-degrading endonuclease RelE of RelBE toxin-antitoxin system